MGRNGAARDGVQVDWRGRPTSALRWYVWSRLAVIVGGVAAVGFGMAHLDVAGLVVVGLGAFAVGFATAGIAD